MSNSYILTNHPIKPSSIPSEEAIISAAEVILDSLSTWIPGKTYYGNIKTFSRSKHAEDGAPWHCRVSEHDANDVTFDDFWSKLGINKATNEKEYIPEIKKVVRIKEISPTQEIWSMYYEFTPPVSPRVFTVLQVVTLKTGSLREGLIVSIPIDLSSEEPAVGNLEPKGAKGRYVSVERIKESSGGSIEWTMATSSSPGGLIPAFLVERSMNKTIAADVPHFLKWVKANHKAPA